MGRAWDLGRRAATRLVRQARERTAPPGGYVDAREPVTLETSEPEPDVMLVRGDTRRCLDRHPGPQEVRLVVEVADATLDRDRSLKQRLYAGAGIPVDRVRNPPDRRLEIYADPSGPAGRPACASPQTFAAADLVPLVSRGPGPLASAWPACKRRTPFKKPAPPVSNSA